MSYMYANEGTNTGATGWGVGLSAIIGGALGYWAGRSGAGGLGTNGYVAPVAVNGLNSTQCSTCFEQGVESGKTLCGLDFIGQQAAMNSRDIGNTFTALSNQMTNQSAAISARFDALNQQKIADLTAENAALRTQNVVGINAAAMNMQLTSLNDKISSIVTNCGVRSYPGCPTTSCCSNQ